MCIIPITKCSGLGDFNPKMINVAEGIGDILPQPGTDYLSLFI